MNSLKDKLMKNMEHYEKYGTFDESFLYVTEKDLEHIKERGEILKRLDEDLERTI